jgi:hypothetical protein
MRWALAARRSGGSQDMLVLLPSLRSARRSFSPPTSSLFGSGVELDRTADRTAGVGHFGNVCIGQLSLRNRTCRIRPQRSNRFAPISDVPDGGDHSWKQTFDLWPEIVRRLAPGLRLLQPALFL